MIQYLVSWIFCWGAINSKVRRLCKSTIFGINLARNSIPCVVVRGTAAWSTAVSSSWERDSPPVIFSLSVVRLEQLWKLVISQNDSCKCTVWSCWHTITEEVGDRATFTCKQALQLLALEWWISRLKIENAYRPMSPNYILTCEALAAGLNAAHTCSICWSWRSIQYVFKQEYSAGGECAAVDIRNEEDLLGLLVLKLTWLMYLKYLG